MYEVSHLFGQGINKGTLDKGRVREGGKERGNERRSILFRSKGRGF